MYKLPGTGPVTNCQNGRRMSGKIIPMLSWTWFQKCNFLPKLILQTHQFLLVRRTRNIRMPVQMAQLCQTLSHCSAAQILMWIFVHTLCSWGHTHGLSHNFLSFVRCTGHRNFSLFSLFQVLGELEYLLLFLSARNGSWRWVLVHCL